MLVVNCLVRHRVPDTIGEMWFIDFMNAQLSSGRSFRLLRVIDGFERKFLDIEVDF
jgi:hypothetical protein